MVSTKSARNIRRLIWLYIWLLIFEGALRKWVLPGLSEPLLIIRDPVVIAIYFLAVKKRLFPQNKFIYGFSILAFIVSLVSILVGLTQDTSNFFVTLYGLRTNFLHLPLIFVIPKVFDLEDVKKVGKWLLVLALPMAILMIFQFISPPNAFINTTAGGEGKQIMAIGGVIRPPGTFSFATGVAQYYPLVAAFLLYAFTQRKVYSYWLIVPASVGLVLGLAVSGSRLALLSVAIVFLAWLLTLLIKPRLIVRSYRLFIIAAILGIGLSFVPVFTEGIEVFMTRLSDASAYEAETGGIWGRITETFLGPFSQLDRIPFFGEGLGVGTNVGSALLTGKVDFLLAEGEWPRILLESGPVLGLMYILLRVALVLWMGWLCIKSTFANNILPLLVLAACAYLLIMGQFGQATTLGFAALGGGLCLAARRTNGIPAISNPPQQLYESVTH